MISLTLAMALRDAGLAWHPRPGDRFVVTSAEMVDDIFHLADMVIEARELDTGVVFAFNGTTEWALDSIAQEHTVWLPREGQLREHLGDAFRRLEVTDQGFEVTVAGAGAPQQFRGHNAAEAYAEALLAQLSR